MPEKRGYMEASVSQGRLNGAGRSRLTDARPELRARVWTIGRREGWHRCVVGAGCKM